MNAIKPNTIVFLTTLSAISSFAQSSELTLATALADPPDPGGQPVSTLSYKKLVTKNLAGAEVSVSQDVTFWQAEKALWNATSIRTNALSITFPRTGIIMENDRASLSIYAPMQSVNGALSFAGYVSQSRMNDSLVKLAQVLSFAARRQINTEFAYSVNVNKYSKFDSIITYRLNAGADSGKSDVVVGVRYDIKF